jgi:3-hydroxybutyryl-CoA dehydrogenase
MSSETPTLGVVGSGTMGSGIAIVGVLAGRRVLLHDGSAPALDAAVERIGRFIEGGVQRNKLTAADAEDARRRIVVSDDLGALDAADLIVETIPEDLAAKQALIETLDEACPTATLIATNTSTLSVTAIAAASDTPSRVVGMHFCNPAPLMKLVEVVEGELTSAKAASDALEWTRNLGKVPVRCRDRPGFILNRVLVPFENDCIRALERGDGTIEEIDLAVREGLRHPMGPFELLDTVGLDVHRDVSNSLFDQLHDERFAPPPLVDRMIEAGHLGRKSGQGFYQYETAGMFGE